MIGKYLVFLPARKGSVIDEFRQCLEQMRSTDLTGMMPVKLTIFTGNSGYPEYLKTLEEISVLSMNHFGQQCPALSIISHPPELPWKVMVEAGFIFKNSGTVFTEWNHATPYIVNLTGGMKEIWAGGLGAGLYPDDTRSAAEAAFSQMKEILVTEQMSFDHIVRQWNYIGKILEVKKEVQNYQTFNEVRSENYHKYRSVHSYPSATGIGMQFGGVILDFCAVKADNNLKIIAIDNPDQIRPYDYGQQVLKGKSDDIKGIKQPPQFERAAFLVNKSDSTLFISGTASIVGQDTIGVNDIEKQTIVTIDNISKLTDTERIRHLTGNAGASAGSLILLRVYVKRQDYLPAVKEICRHHFPDVPCIYVEADICRDDLLVEIEAEYSNKIT